MVEVASNLCTLNDCVASCFAPSVLQPENAVECPGCQNRVCASQQTKFKKTPDVLATQIKKFHYNTDTGSSKSTATVTTDLSSLDLCGYVSADHSGLDPIYQCYAFIEHYGTTPQSGHYTACVLGEDQTWRRYNDDTVSVISGEVDTKNAYIALWRRKGPWDSVDQSSDVLSRDELINNVVSTTATNVPAVVSSGSSDLSLSDVYSRPPRPTLPQEFFFLLNPNCSRTFPHS